MHRELVFEIWFIQRKIIFGFFSGHLWEIGNIFVEKICPLVTRIFYGKLYFKIQSKIEEIYAYTHM